jgi:hypothetical protein
MPTLHPHDSFETNESIAGHFKALIEAKSPRDHSDESAMSEDWFWTSRGDISELGHEYIGLKTSLMYQADELVHSARPEGGCYAGCTCCLMEKIAQGARA